MEKLSEDENGQLVGGARMLHTKEDIDEYLLGNGKIDWNNSNIERTKRTCLSFSSCRECKLLPICNGGCSQKRIESVKNEKCILSLDEISKQEFIKSIIYGKILSMRLQKNKSKI